MTDPSRRAACWPRGTQDGPSARATARRAPACVPTRYPSPASSVPPRRCAAFYARAGRRAWRAFGAAARRRRRDPASAAVQSARRHARRRGRTQDAGPATSTTIFPIASPTCSILVGAGYSLRYVTGGVALGWAAAVAAVFTAYVRLLGGSLGVTQHFIGPMAKQHRMFTLTLAALLSAVEALLGAAAAGHAARPCRRDRAGSIVTAWRRTARHRDRGGGAMIGTALAARRA